MAAAPARAPVQKGRSPAPSCPDEAWTSASPHAIRWPHSRSALAGGSHAPQRRFDHLFTSRQTTMRREWGQRSGGRVVMQRPAKPRTSVRFRPGPPSSLSCPLRDRTTAPSAVSPSGTPLIREAMNTQVLVGGPPACGGQDDDRAVTVVSARRRRKDRPCGREAECVTEGGA